MVTDDLLPARQHRARRQIVQLPDQSGQRYQRPVLADPRPDRRFDPRSSLDELENLPALRVEPVWNPGAPVQSAADRCSSTW